MLKKSAACLPQKILKPFCYRLVRQLQTDNLSYLRNPGSEPLILATLGDVIADTAHKYPGRVAIRSVHEDVTITYEELLNKADSLGCALRARGFEKGDRLGLWSHNCSGWIIAMVAAVRAGLISVLINPVYEKDELSLCINKIQLKGLLVGEKMKNRDYYGLLNKMIPELDTSKEYDLKSKNFPSLKTILTMGKEKLNGVATIDFLINDNKNNGEISRYDSEVKPEDGSCITLTSGTMGEPKASVLSHFGLVNSTYFTGKRMSLDAEQQKICVQVPLFHALGSVVTLLGPLHYGSTVVLAAPTYNVAANINALHSEKCTIITGTPTMYVDMLANLKSEVVTRLRLALVAGASCSPRLVGQMKAQMNSETIQALYGLTETTGGVIQSLLSDSLDLVAKTVGYISEHIELKVVDSCGNTVPFGSPGELMVRGYCTMLHYWNEPTKTQEALQEDGWLHTGDMFTLSPDGYATIVGRIKDIIIRGGENIAPKEIEDLLNTHPDIVESQVIGVSDERLGEELCAVVRVRDDATFTTQDISNHCGGKLARFKIPRILKIVDDFPKTVSGKIEKHKLKELVDLGKI